MTQYIEQKFDQRLAERTQQGNKRVLTTSEMAIDFVSNDYLGLSRSQVLHENVNQRVTDNLSLITNLNGSTGSRLLAGNSNETEKLENKLADIFNCEATLLFNSGYVANLALISTLAQRGDTIVYDSLAHVCIKEGAWLSKAQTFSFRHNDVEDLDMKLKNAKGDKFVVIESVYSMDGDFASFNEIIAVAKKHNAYLICDEAHGTGVFGKQGAGKLFELGIEKDFGARIYTFGKGMGVHGACVAGSQNLIDYLINFARPFIYTTALPVHSVFAIEQAFDLLGSSILLQSELQKKIDLFNAEFDRQIGTSDQCQKLNSETAIQPLVIAGNERVKHIAETLQSQGYDIRAILSPTVKTGAERLRICLHTFNTDQEIIGLIAQLSKLF